MKSVFVWLTILALSTAMLAQSGTATSKPKRTKAKKQPAAVTAEDVQALRDAMAAQQKRIEQLEEQMRQRDEALQQAQQQAQQAQSTAAEAQNKAAAAQATLNDQKDSVSKLQNQMGDVQVSMTSAAATSQEEQKKLSAVEGLLGRFRFTGDIRVRQEDFFQSWSGCPPHACDVRARERIRLRFGVEGQLGQDFYGGIFVASGVLTDPTSTNETLTNVFEKKTIGFDRGWITFQPQEHKWLQLTGGKWAYTWQRTSVTFDPDLNPEGFSERFSFDFAHPVVKNLTVMGMQLFFNEVRAGLDSYATGGQVSAKLQLGKRITSTPSFLLMRWDSTGAILNEPTSVTGAATVGPFAPNGLTNCTITVAPGVRRYCSGWFYSDLILNNQVKTGWRNNRLPFNLLLEFEDNLAAKDNAHGHPAPRAYYAEASFGQTRDKGDFQFGYAFLRQEQDSVISSFNESDQRAPTNVLQHRLFFLYKVRKNTVLSFTDWIGRTLDSTLSNAILTPGIVPGQHELYLNRLQFDVIYTF